jgi:hypothetical protein
MSSNPPDEPGDPSPEHAPGNSPRGRIVASILAGIAVGVAVLIVTYFAVSLPNGLTSPIGVGLVALIPLVVYVVLAVVLAARGRTALFGTGLLLGLGVWLLIGGEYCVSFHVGSGV